jgi:DNA polymerase-1
VNYECVTTEAQLDEWLKLLRGTQRFALDTETTSTDPMSCQLVGICVAVPEGDANRACYIPLSHRVPDAQLPLATVLKALAPICADASIAKTLQNAVYDLVVLARYGIEVVNVDDTMLMSYALQGRNPDHWHGMDDLAPLHLGRGTIAFTEVVVPELGMENFSDVSLWHATQYAAEDADVTLDLFYELRAKLKEENLWSVYAEIDRPLIPALAEMKLNGVAVSLKKFREMEDEWTAAKDALEDEIFAAAPEMKSLTPAEIGKYLFDICNIDPVKWTKKSGSASTDAEALEALEDEHPVIPLILKQAKLKKLLSTYVLPMPELVHPETGRVHTDIMAHVTNTARFSSRGPNLQNIPVRTKEGKRIRAAFVAPRGFKLVDADYSQIELRILAHVSQDATLMRAFHEGKDVHAATATEIFNVTPEEIGEKEFAEFRARAKTINFGIVYGITQIGLSKQLKIDPDEAQDYIDRYLDRLPGVRDYIERTKAAVHRDGYTETIWGRRIYQPGIRGNRAMQGHAERAAVNAPIQGSAADLIRKAMGFVIPELKLHVPEAAMLLQVHDELLFEVPEEQAEATKDVVKHVMQTAGDDVEWSVPIIVDVKAGDNWAEAH